MLSMKRHILLIFSIIALFLFNTGFNKASAQSSEAIKKWNFLTEVYIMFPNMDGELGIGNNLKLPVDANPGDIFSKLKMAGMIYFEANTKKWAITSDLVYMNLKQDVTPGVLLYSGNVNAKQFIWEAAGLYRLTSFLEIGAGGRLNYLQTGVDARINTFPAGTEEVTGDKHKTWYDPILIARLTTDINDKWLFQFRGDVGGFGIGSDLTWQLQGYAGYRFSKVFQLSAGYRILSTDFNYGEDRKQFIFDVNEFGPVIRIGFNF
jgi:hypothetical protein